MVPRAVAVSYRRFAPAICHSAPRREAAADDHQSMFF
jgi:hypothetical protein